ncbi:hypothetical protein [Amaricoccus solimangrovi]|uniref:Uncharacterized protein n=1 Tax=Amaricoccus solimangrovi TaxID=2589815 RepID=A0A501X107_9RHOB|nr:hypothetical protein [Amaricoccus solimangrovi]TPE53911.1 hypothetical protein FJM51_02370 [Amaricoccus solimangrovi]
MAFENLRMGIAMLLDEIEKNPENRHELQESLREKLTEMRDLGLPLPEDLVRLEDYLEEEDSDSEEETAEAPAGPADEV